MKSIIFVSSVADPVSGESAVMMKCGDKEYTGKAHIHPDDVWGELTGCTLAEYRAVIKIFKDELKKQKYEYKILKNFVNAIISYKDFDSNSSSAKKMFRQLNIKEKQVNKIKTAIDDLETILQKMIIEKENVKTKFSDSKDS